MVRCEASSGGYAPKHCRKKATVNIGSSHFCDEHTKPMSWFAECLINHEANLAKLHEQNLAESVRIQTAMDKLKIEKAEFESVKERFEKENKLEAEIEFQNMNDKVMSNGNKKLL
jgi:hypothetical protein